MVVEIKLSIQPDGNYPYSFEDLFLECGFKHTRKWPSNQTTLMNSFSNHYMQWLWAPKELQFNQEIQPNSHMTQRPAPGKNSFFWCWVQRAYYIHLNIPSIPMTRNTSADCKQLSRLKAQLWTVKWIGSLMQWKRKLFWKWLHAWQSMLNKIIPSQPHWSTALGTYKAFCRIYFSEIGDDFKIWWKVLVYQSW